MLPVCFSATDKDSGQQDNKAAPYVTHKERFKSGVLIEIKARTCFLFITL
jgi:hypothetical protein